MASRKAAAVGSATRRRNAPRYLRCVTSAFSNEAFVRDDKREDSSRKKPTCARGLLLLLVFVHSFLYSAGGTSGTMIIWTPRDVAAGSGVCAGQQAYQASRPREDDWFIAVNICFVLVPLLLYAGASAGWWMWRHERSLERRGVLIHFVLLANLAAQCIRESSPHQGRAKLTGSARQQTAAAAAATCALSHLTTP